MQRNHKTYFRWKLSKPTMVKHIDDNFSAYNCSTMKKTSLDPNIAVSPEKHLYSTWSRKPGKYYTALPKLNIQRFASGFFEAIVLTNAKQML